MEKKIIRSKVSAISCFLKLNSLQNPQQSRIGLGSGSSAISLHIDSHVVLGSTCISNNSHAP